MSQSGYPPGTIWRIVQPLIFYIKFHWWRLIHKAGLIESDLSARVILWFSTYAGLQHILWRSLQYVEKNDGAAAVIRTALKAWAIAAKDAPILISDLRASRRSWLHI
jgi:hypothetical protein